MLRRSFHSVLTVLFGFFGRGVRVSFAVSLVIAISFGFRLRSTDFGTLLPDVAFADPVVVPTAPGNSEPVKVRPLSLELNEQGISALKQNNPSLGEELFRKSLETDPGNLTAVYNLSGALLFNQKKDEAHALLKNYTQRYQSDAGLFSMYGNVLFSEDNIKGAADNYEKAMAIDRDYPRIEMKLGLAYALLNRLDESEQMYLGAVQKSPQDAELLGNLSGVFLANGKPDKAVVTAQQALHIKSTAKVYVTLGSAYEAQKHFPEALDAYHHARDLGAQGKELDQKIRSLEALPADSVSTSSTGVAPKKILTPAAASTRDLPADRNDSVRNDSVRVDSMTGQKF